MRRLAQRLFCCFLSTLLVTCLLIIFIYNNNEKNETLNNNAEEILLRRIKRAVGEEENGKKFHKIRHAMKKLDGLSGDILLRMILDSNSNSQPKLNNFNKIDTLYTLNTSFNTNKTSEKMLEKGNFNRSEKLAQTSSAHMEEGSSKIISSQKLQDIHLRNFKNFNISSSGVCYATDDVLLIIAITCSLNFAFVLLIVTLVKYFSAGGAAKEFNQMNSTESDFVDDIFWCPSPILKNNELENRNEDLKSLSLYSFRTKDELFVPMLKKSYSLSMEDLRFAH